MLLFKKKFLDAIRTGRKTQTIRVWTHRRLRAGQRSYIPGVGYIRVESVDRVTLSVLTEQDARLDGFDTLSEMLCELSVIYRAELELGWDVFRIGFVVLPPHEQLALRESRRLRKLQPSNPTTKPR